MFGVSLRLRAVVLPFQSFFEDSYPCCVNFRKSLLRPCEFDWVVPKVQVGFLQPC